MSSRAGVPRVQIDKINTRLAVEPSSGGWYKLDTRITREPILDLTLTGRLNLDTFTAADAVVTINAQVSSERESFLPPELQTFLRELVVFDRCHGLNPAQVSAGLAPRIEI